jgi:hypothetical protein
MHILACGTSRRHKGPEPDSIIGMNLNISVNRNERNVKCELTATFSDL